MKKSMDTVIEFGGRRSGRTTRLINWLLEGRDNGEQRVIMVHAENEASRIKELIWKQDKNSNKTPIEDWQVTSYRSTGLVGKRVAQVAIDNLELFLPPVGPITLITATLAEDYRTHHQSGFKPEFPVQFRHIGE